MLKKIFKKFKRYKEDINLKEVCGILRTNPDAVLLDVRSIQEFAEGHLNNAINIPLYELNVKANEKLKDKCQIIIIYCSAGIKSKKAVGILQKMGYKNLYNVEEGIRIEESTKLLYFHQRKKLPKEEYIYLV